MTMEFDPNLAPVPENDIRAFWSEVFQQANFTPEQNVRERIAVCYRLTRKLAECKGICTSGQTLTEGTNMEPSPWTNPVTAIFPGAPNVARHNLIRTQTTSMSLLPPPPDNPNPRMDKPLARWLAVMISIARRLNITASEEGRRGLYKLLDPAMVRDLWIKPVILQAYEEWLLSQALDFQLDKGPYEGQHDFMRAFHLTVYESQAICSLARVAAPDVTSDNVETKKALMELRIDKFIRRARDENDLRAELQGLKLLSVIQGLHKTEPEDDLTGMINVVAEETQSKELENGDSDDETE